MTGKKDAILLGPFVGELYWETARFAPLISYLKNREFKKRDITYIVLTRPDRFDLYGKYADILVPLNIEGDYINKFPNCFRLNNFSNTNYQKIANKFKSKYAERFNIIRHIFPDVTGKKFMNKNQYPKQKMIFNYQPRKENYDIVNKYLNDKKPIVVLAPRFRKGFRRNWRNWNEFYDLIFQDKSLMNNFDFIVCGKSDEYVPDAKKRFLDLNEMKNGGNSSLVGLLLVVLEKAILVCGSQSALPNMGLLYKVEVLTFGCQKKLHTKTYNIHNSPIEFIENKKYNIPAGKLFKHLKRNLKRSKNG